MTNLQQKLYTIKSILLFILLLFGFVSQVYAVDVTLQWNSCSEPDLAGYRLFFREKGQAYDYTNPALEVTESWCTLDNLDENKTYYFVVRAFDINGLESGDSNEVRLESTPMPYNRPPIAVIAEDSIEAVSGMTVTLDGSRSTDPDDGIDSYHWTQIDGLPVVLSNPDSETATFTAPETAPYDSHLTFRLTVTDFGGTQSKVDCFVYIASENTPETVVLEAHFDVDNDGFIYVDDAFRYTSQPRYVEGTWTAFGGFMGGALQITMGGIDSAYILDMSGGWRQDFVLSVPAELVLSFRYKLTQWPNYEFDELSQVLVSIDHILYGEEDNDHVVEIRGDGNGGTFENTGWQLFEVNLGILEAGNHTLTIGGYNNKKTYYDESTRVLIDDVLVKSLDKSNRAPYVDAGFDQMITLDEHNVYLDGTMMDDGLPGPPAALSTVWYKVSGPGTVNFFDARAVNTHASFSEAGRYVLELIAYDGEFISRDHVTITVTP
jgi:K319L-like, PKD domain